MKGIAINDLPARYQQQVRQQLASAPAVSRTPSDLEPHPGNALLAKKEAQGFDGQVSIAFIEKRHRLADPDGACVKYVLDGIVSAGLLQGDSAKEIWEIKKRQIQIRKELPEETIVEIWRKKQ